MTPAAALQSHVHRFEPAAAGTRGSALLLLHGTGGDERGLLPLGRMLAPGAALLAPRGNVLEAGMPRFFRRLAEGVFDLDDLRARAAELAEFIAAARVAYGLDAGLIAVGFSNGANIAAYLLLAHPKALDGAILLRPMMRFGALTRPDLTGVPVFVGGGELDPIAPPVESEKLAEALREAGADVTLNWERAGHSVGLNEVKVAREWLARLAAR
jgi:predicted esterase